MIEQAIALAVKEHVGQVDKANMPYILHPLRVLGNIGLADDDILCAAVLHDVVEDCNVTLENLEMRGFSLRTVELVRLLTRQPNESYEDFIGFISTDRDASWIKVCDLRDNQNVARLIHGNPQGIDRKTYERQAKYKAAELRLCTKWGFT